MEALRRPLCKPARTKFYLCVRQRRATSGRRGTHAMPQASSASAQRHRPRLRQPRASGDRCLPGCHAPASSGGAGTSTGDLAAGAIMVRDDCRPARRRRCLHRAAREVGTLRKARLRRRSFQEGPIRPCRPACGYALRNDSPAAPGAAAIHNRAAPRCGLAPSRSTGGCPRTCPQTGMPAKYFTQPVVFAATTRTGDFLMRSPALSRTAAEDSGSDRCTGLSRALVHGRCGRNNRLGRRFRQGGLRSRARGWAGAICPQVFRGLSTAPVDGVHRQRGGRPAHRVSATAPGDEEVAAWRRFRAAAASSLSAEEPPPEAGEHGHRRR